MRKSSQLASVVLFVYNRPSHTRRVLEALAKNKLAKDSILYVFCDGPKQNASETDLQKIYEVRELVALRPWCGKVYIIERDRNWGLAKNIVDGVTSVLSEHDKVIILEDDIETSSGFLKYMNDALDFYDKEGKVWHISGYMFPVKKVLPSTFFYNTASCWGWGTWRDKWKLFNPDAGELLREIESKGLLDKFNIEGTYPFEDQLRDNAEGRLDTWAVKWYASIFLNDGYSLHPYPSLTQNIGNDGTGENSGRYNIYDWVSLADEIQIKNIPIEESTLARKEMRKFHRRLRPRGGIMGKLVSILKWILPSIMVSHIRRFKTY